MKRIIEILEGKNHRVSSKRIMGILGFVVACSFAYIGNNDFANACLTFAGSLLLGGLAERKDNVG